MDGHWSIYTGVSPMASRCCSVDLSRDSAGTPEDEDDVREDWVDQQ